MRISSGNYFGKDSFYGRSVPRELCRKEIYGDEVSGFLDSVLRVRLTNGARF